MKSLRLLSLVALLFCLFSCVDPVEPTYRFENSFLLVEGQIVNVPEESEVRISRSQVVFDAYSLFPVEGATVTSVASDGSEANWIQVSEGENAYRPNPDFVAREGLSYYIRVVTTDGQVVESLPEKLPATVPIAEAELRFEQESFFSDARNRFIPAFRLLVDLNDPAGVDNYYQFRFKYWENIAICITCERSAFRNGACVETPNSRFRNFDYLCDVPCWTNKRGSSINILSDEFSAGQRIENIEAGRIEFDRRGGLLAAVQQYTITKEAFDYAAVLKDLATGTGGLNATLPAALVGNLRDLNDVGATVLGYVQVSSLSEERIFLDRDTFTGGEPLPFNDQPNLEFDFIPSPPLAPCVGRNRTTVEPDGWQ